MSPEPSPAAPGSLGIVVAGSSSRGVDVRLDSEVSVEDIVVGRYVTVQGEKRRFFGMITEVSLETTDPTVAASPPDTSDPLMSGIMRGTATYGKMHVLLSLTLSGAVAGSAAQPEPVKSVPAHFSPVCTATQADVELVFGSEDEKRYYIGTPLDMETKVCLDVLELVKRSNGVFGKTGTGKTFLTRLLLIGMIQKKAAVSLIFDMHSEYGWGTKKDERGLVPKGLKQIPSFASLVQVFTLDEEGSRRRGISPDFVVRIPYSDIEPEDIELLRLTLNLTEPAVQAAYQFARRYGEGWLQALMDLRGDDLKEVLKDLAVHESTHSNLRRGLATLRRFSFLVSSPVENTVKRILDSLERGINVVLEFGRFEDYAAYILVANLLSRRIYDTYRERTEKATAQNAAPPRPLVIVLEEAHRFLNPQLSGQTVFGTIAREMRKYNVTLLIVDQRPSGIDSEVLSQLGTKITCLLDNEQDVDAVLGGVPGRGELKAVLSRLESKQQALIFGHSVPMPLVVRTREYGSAESYKEFSAPPKRPGPAPDSPRDLDDLWPA